MINHVDLEKRKMNQENIETSTFELLKILPSLSELLFCIRTNKFRRHENIIYKLLLDFYLELYLQKKCFGKVIKKILPMTIKLLKEIDARDLRHITSSINCIKE